MVDTSFRDILAQLLEENPAESTVMEPAPPIKNTIFTPPPHLYAWQDLPLPKSHSTHRPNASTGASAYARTTNPAQATRAKSASAPQAPVKPEIVIATGTLATVDQARVMTLQRLGATEFTDGISLSGLKRAHRRLAKALHPDLLNASLSARDKERRNSQFLLLQEAYEGLSQTLRQYILRMETETSAAVPGSESASESNRPRRDAA